MTVDLGEYLDVRTLLGDPRRTDEYAPQRAVPDACEVDIGLKALDLPAKRVAARADVHQPEMTTVEHDQPRAGPQHGQATPHERSQRLGQALALDAKRHRGRLPPGDHESLKAVEVSGSAHLADACAEPAQHPLVRLEPTLKRQHADQRKPYW